MYKKEIFHIDLPDGYMDINVGAFFGTSTKKNIEKLLKIAKLHCPESRKAELRQQIRNERDHLDDVLDELWKLEDRRFEILAELFDGQVTREEPAAAKAIKTRDAKLLWSLNLLLDTDEKARWTG